MCVSWFGVCYSQIFRLQWMNEFSDAEQMRVQRVHTYERQSPKIQFRYQQSKTIVCALRFLATIKILSENMDAFAFRNVMNG